MKLEFLQAPQLEFLKEGKYILKNETPQERFKQIVAKNKVAPPFRVVEFDIMYGKGISRAGEVLDIAVDANIIQKSGSWYSYETTKLGQGRDAVKELIQDNPEMMAEIEAKIRSKMAGGEEILAVQAD